MCIRDRLYRVLALDGGPQVSTATVEDSVSVQSQNTLEPIVDAAESGKDDDESLAFFKKLAED